MFQNFCQNHPRLLQDIMIPVSQYTIAAILQESSSLVVIALLRGVLSTVQFND